MQCACAILSSVVCLTVLHFSTFSQKLHGLKIMGFEHETCVLISSSSSSMALQPGVGLGLLYNTPPSLSIPCSVPPFGYSHLSQVRGHVIQPSHFWSSSSSCSIQLSVHLFFFWNCGVLHSFYMTKPSYSLAFYKPDNVLPLNYSF